MPSASAAARTLTDERLNAPLTPICGRRAGILHPAGWVAAKSVQHTWEHGCTIMQIDLFIPREQRWDKDQDADARRPALSLRHNLT